MPSTPLRLLMIEDSPDDAELVLRELRRGGFEPQPKIIATESQMRAALDDGPWDIIISDFSMPSFSGLRCLTIYREYQLDLPFILVSGTVGEEIAVNAMKQGAHDYIMKNQLTRLVPAVQRELGDARVRAEHRQAMERLEYLAYHDPGTGLPNRTAFLDKLHAVIQQAQELGQQILVASININNAIEILHTLGSDIHTALLRQLAERLQSTFPAHLVCARIRENSFALALPLHADFTLDAAAAACQTALEDPFDIGVSQLHMDTSIGLAMFPADSGDAETLLRAASVAMHQAVNSMQPTMRYSAALDHATPQRLSLLGELRQAIRDNQLELHYQPKVNLQTGTVAGAEALIRWNHPQRGQIPPAEFIEPAEHSGLIRPLTEWVIDAAFRQAQQWREAGTVLKIAINLSARNVQDMRLVEYIKEMVQRYQVQPRHFELEVTESTIMLDVDTAQQVLGRLHDMGFVIAVDDFGTGQSSLAYIRRLPIHQIKIDRSFIRNLATDPDNQVIVKATVDMAHSLNLQVVAEGVETDADMQILKDMSCRYAQGYGIAKPMPVHTIPNWLNDGAWLYAPPTFTRH